MRTLSKIDIPPKFEGLYKVDDKNGFVFETDIRFIFRNKWSTRTQRLLRKEKKQKPQ